MEMSTYVINEAARVIQKRALMMRKPEMPAARRLKGAAMAVKKETTSARKAMR